MKKDKWWLKQEISEFFWRAEIDDNLNIQDANLIFDKIDDVIDQLDEPKKPVIPQFVADWFESNKEGLADAFTFRQTTYPKKPLDERDDIDNWFANTDDVMDILVIMKNGYEVEKEVLWEIPIPFTVTSSGRIQYLIYDPKAKTYLANRKNGQLKQTFNAKDLASVPTPYRHYAVLRDFKKIEEVTK